MVVFGCVYVFICEKVVGFDGCIVLVGFVFMIYDCVLGGFSFLVGVGFF